MSDSDGTKNLLIAIGVVVIVFGLLFSVNLFFKPKPVTVDSLVDKTLSGEQNPETNFVYHGFVFIEVGGLWQTQWQFKNTQYIILLHYSPLELENIKIVGDINSSFDSKEIYLTFDPLGSELKYVAMSAGEISLNLVRALNTIPVAACSRNETDACADRPIINCSNTDKPVIFLKESNETMIDLKGNCIILQGAGADIAKVSERMIYQWYGIMEREQ
jgi:hypothetical protein